MEQLVAIFSALPPECWYGAAGTVISLAVAALHSRGWRVPILEAILDRVLRQYETPDKVAADERALDVKVEPEANAVLDATIALALKDLPDGPSKKLIEALIRKR